MIERITDHGRCELDRKTPFNTWSNQATHDFFGDLAKDWGCSRSDVIEGVARASRDNPEFLAQLKRSTLLAQNDNRKHPVEIPAAASELTPEEAYQHMATDLKKGEKKEDIIAHFEALDIPITVDVLEREEDKIYRREYEEKKHQASEAETLYKGDSLYGARTKLSRNEAAYADRVKELRAEYEAEKAGRQPSRDQRRKLLLGAAALLVAPLLREPGNPHYHRQYARPSHFDTSGPLTRSDLKKDSS